MIYCREFIINMYYVKYQIEVLDISKVFYIRFYIVCKCHRNAPCTFLQTLIVLIVS